MRDLPLSGLSESTPRRTAGRVGNQGFSAIFGTCPTCPIAGQPDNLCKLLKTKGVRCPGCPAPIGGTTPVGRAPKGARVDLQKLKGMHHDR
jgi:hypothetical protein